MRNIPLRPPDEVKDHHDKQNDDEKPDQAIARACDCEWHLMFLSRLGLP